MGGVGEEGCRQTVGLTRLSRGPVRSLAQKEREASEVRLRYLGLGASCGPLDGGLPSMGSHRVRHD